MAAWEKGSRHAPFPWNTALLALQTSFLPKCRSVRHRIGGQTSTFGKYFLRHSASLHQWYQRDWEIPKAFYHFRKVCPMYTSDHGLGIEFFWSWAAEGGGREHSRSVWPFTRMCSRDFRVWNGFEFVMFYFFRKIIIVFKDGFVEVFSCPARSRCRFSPR